MNRTSCLDSATGKEAPEIAPDSPIVSVLVVDRGIYTAKGAQSIFAMSWRFESGDGAHLHLAKSSAGYLPVDRSRMRSVRVVHDLGHGARASRTEHLRSFGTSF